MDHDYILIPKGIRSQLRQQRIRELSLAYAGGGNSASINATTDQNGDAVPTHIHDAVGEFLDRLNIPFHKDGGSSGTLEISTKDGALVTDTDNETDYTSQRIYLWEDHQKLPFPTYTKEPNLPFMGTTIGLWLTSRSALIARIAQQIYDCPSTNICTLSVGWAPNMAFPDQPLYKNLLTVLQRVSPILNQTATETIVHAAAANPQIDLMLRAYEFHLATEQNHRVLRQLERCGWELHAATIATLL
jgi:hypothetical protein